MTLPGAEIMKAGARGDEFFRAWRGRTGNEPLEAAGLAPFVGEERSESSSEDEVCVPLVVAGVL